MPRRKKVDETIIIEGPEFTCSFLELHEFQTVKFNSSGNQDELRMARYHGSNFWNVKGFGVNRWVIAGYINVDWQGLMEQGYTKEEIFKGCAKFLNKPPERKRFQKRISKPLFGTLLPKAVKINPREKNGRNVLEVLAVTNKRKSKYVWGEGQTVPIKARRSKLL